MKLFSSITAYIVEDDGHRLICSRLDGRLSVAAEQEAPLDAEEICDVIAVLGRIDLEGVNYLLFVSESTVVAEFNEHNNKHAIHRIDKVKALPLDSEDVGASASVSATSIDSSSHCLKHGTGRLIKFVQDKIGNAPKQFSMLDEILRLFNERPSFYFCLSRDITHCTYRRFSSQQTGPDERFFWNKLLLKDLLEDGVDKKLAARWIIPIMQGKISFGSLAIVDGSQVNSSLNILLVSRRSVYRAGMRYLRRGIDCESNVANFVETELILNIFDHHLSFVQVRGSVPIFWSQKGFKYRPPLSIDRNIEESLPYFTTHMEDLLHRYGPPLVAVSLVDQTGRELQLAANFVEHSARMDCSDLYLVSFDLHQHCKGLNFDKIGDLIVNMESLLEQIGYCWVDKTGEIVKTQRGVIRTNCVDCLDRTNLVQARLFGPLCDPPETLVTLLQNMWADNGDAISTQYAGTAALKGDVTRSGERCLAGIVRDGYNSASRYYLSHMRDSSRQKAINALLGYKDQGSESMVESDSDSEEDENICRLAAETVNFLLPVGEIVVGAWALCNLEQDAETIDTILILTRTKIYVAVYDDDFEKLIAVSILPLDDISSIEVGKSGRSSCVYLRVTCNDNTWTWRAGRTRLFNNVAIRLKTPDEANEYTESIAEQENLDKNDHQPMDKEPQPEFDTDSVDPVDSYTSREDAIDFRDDMNRDTASTAPPMVL
ncbi:unnamed protein product [Angiostrongylus costaricensis]|uniref:SAC domain-containing protein n=1 Tax=Angiostrongylus costaricensis TaxID=334426 RepID=A0A0R3PKC6_ANGCS|nr:unnamed protein product [Angiostrongylus costaricensis]